MMSRAEPHSTKSTQQETGMSELTGKVALVTGGSRGIGAAIAGAWRKTAPTWR
jgi:hypothetical protein